MSSYLKRRVALILAVAIISAQLSACKKLNEVPVQNEAPVATVQQENTEEPTEATEPEVGGLEWLQENLENLKQSLLDGDYAKVVEQLLEMRDELKDNARYNALLYIAYSGKGDKDKANDLLNNKNLNRNEFMDAFLEFTNALKGNAGAKSAEQQLMDAMMHLAQKDKTAYNAAVRVGQNIQNENPSDPNAYVVMYIAALAGNDKAAMKDVLSQAKANGISAKVLSTATVEYIERVNVTDVTTEDAKKGIESSTSFNGKGERLKIEETVTNKDGTKTKVIRSSDGGISDEITYSKGGQILSAVHYDCDYAVEKDADGNEKIVAKVTGKIETTYKNGKLESVTYYNGKDEKTTSISINPKTGDVKDAKVFSSDGNALDMPEDQRKLLDFEMEDGRVKSYVVPRTFSDGTKGFSRIGLDYFNGYGAPVLMQEWLVEESKKTKLSEFQRTIDFDKDKMGLRTADEFWQYSPDGTFAFHVKEEYTFDGLTRTGYNITRYLEDDSVLRTDEIVRNQNGQFVKIGRTDYTYSGNLHMKSTIRWDKDSGETTVEEYLLYKNGEFAQGSKKEYKDGAINRKTEWTPEEKILQYYDDDGNYNREQYVTTNDGEVLVADMKRYHDENDNQVEVLNDYEKGVKLVTTSSTGKMYSEKYKHTETGDVIVQDSTLVYENGQYVGKDNYYEDGKIQRTEDTVWSNDLQSSTKVSDKTYVYDSETGDLKGYTKTEYDAEGNVTSTKNYDPDGNELPEGVTLNLLEEEQPVVEEEVIEENQFAEEEPTEPEQPTEEVKPTEPEQPTEEVKPTESEEPTEEVKPTEPEQPTEEVRPTEPELPTEEVKPTEPEQPTEEAKPTEPGQPAEPGMPTEPEKSAGETQPATPEKPAEEVRPTEPADYAEERKPAEEKKPDAPADSAPASSVK